MNLKVNSSADKYVKLKMGLIPVLMLGLFYVLFAPESGTTPPPTVATSNVSAPAETVNSPINAEDENQSKRVIPEISLAETTAHDPFALLPILRPKKEPVVEKRIASNSTLSVPRPNPGSKANLEMEKEDEEQARIASLKEAINQLVVQGIFVAGNKRSVLINSRIFREGDELTEGVKILKINSHDVVLDLGQSERIQLK